MNRAMLIGRLGHDPETGATNNGQEYARFSLATTSRWKDREGNRKEATEWHRVVVYGPLANVVAQYCGKGDQIAIVGEIRTRKWVDQAGQDRYTTEIVLSGPAATLELLGGNRSAEGQQQQMQQPMQQQPMQQQQMQPMQQQPMQPQVQQPMQPQVQQPMQPSYQPDPNIDDEIPF